MPKKIVEDILRELKSAGVDLGENADKVAAKLDKLDFPEGLADGQMAVDEAHYREIKQDLTKLRTRVHEAEDKAADLKRVLDAGDSENAKKVEILTKKLETLEPTTERLKDWVSNEWERIEDQIPKELRDRFSFAEKDDDGKITKALELDATIANLDKVQEYKEIGALKIEGNGGPPAPGDKTKPGSARTSPTGETEKVTRKDLDTMSPTKKMEAGYGSTPGQSTS